MSLSGNTNMPLKPVLNPEDVLLVPELPGEQKHWRDRATSFFSGRYSSRNGSEERRLNKNSLLVSSRSLTRLKNKIPTKVKYPRCKSSPAPVVLRKFRASIQQPKASLRENSGVPKIVAAEIEFETLPSSDIGTLAAMNTEPEKSDPVVDSLKLKQGSTLFRESCISPIPALALESSSAYLSKEVSPSVSHKVVQRSVSVEDDNESHSSPQNSIIKGDVVVPAYLNKSDPVTRVLFPDNSALNQHNDNKIVDNSVEGEEAKEAKKPDSYMMEILPTFHSKETLENSIEAVEQFLETPPHMRSNFSNFQSKNNRATRALKSTSLLGEPKSGVVVDNRLVLSPSFVELKIEGASSHVSSRCEIQEHTNNQPTKSSDNSNKIPGMVLNLNEIVVTQDTKSVCSNVKSNIVLRTVQPETNPFLNFKSENNVSLDVEMLSSSHPEHIVDQSLSSKATSSSPHVQSDDSGTALSSQAVPTNLPGDENSSKQVEAPIFFLGGHSPEEDTEKGPKLKFTKELGKFDKLVNGIVSSNPVEEVVSETRHIPLQVEVQVDDDDADSFTSTNPFKSCVALKSTNPFDIHSPSNTMDLSRKKLMTNSCPQISISEIEVGRDCSVKAMTTEEVGIMFTLKEPNGDKNKKLNELFSNTCANKNSEESIKKVLFENVAYKSDSEGQKPKLLKHNEKQTLSSAAADLAVRNDSPVNGSNTWDHLPSKSEKTLNIYNHSPRQASKHPLVSIFKNFCHPDIKTHLVKEVFPYGKVGNNIFLLGLRAEDDTEKQERLRSIWDSQLDTTFNRDSDKDYGGSILNLSEMRDRQTVHGSYSKLLFSNEFSNNVNSIMIPPEKNSSCTTNMPNIALHKSKSLQIVTNDGYNQKKFPSLEIAANVSHQVKQDFNEKKIRDFYSLEVSDNLTCNLNEKETPYIVELGLSLRNLKSTTDECLNQCTVSLVEALKSKLCSVEPFASITINEVIATEGSSAHKELIVLHFKMHLQCNAKAELFMADLQKTIFQEELQNILEENLHDKTEFQLEKVQVNSILKTDYLESDAVKVPFCSKISRGLGVVTNIVTAQTVWEQPNTLFSFLCFWLALFNMNKGFFYGLIIYNAELPDQGIILNAIGVTFLIVSCSRYGIFFYLSRARNELASRLPSTVFCLDQVLLVIGGFFVTYGDTTLALAHWNTKTTLPDTRWYNLVNQSPSIIMNISRAIQFWPIVIYCWMTLILIGHRTATVTIEWFTVSIAMVFQSAVFLPVFRDLLVWFVLCSNRYDIWTILGLFGSSLKVTAVLTSMHVQIMGSLNHPSLKYIFYPYAIILISGSLLNNLAFSMYTINHLEADVLQCIQMLFDAFLFLVLDFLAFASILLIFRLSISVRGRRFQINNSSVRCDAFCKREKLLDEREAAAVVARIKGEEN